MKLKDIWPVYLLLFLDFLTTISGYMIYKGNVFELNPIVRSLLETNNIVGMVLFMFVFVPLYLYGFLSLLEESKRKKALFWILCVQVFAVSSNLFALLSFLSLFSLLIVLPIQIFGIYCIYRLFRS